MAAQRRQHRQRDIHDLPTLIEGGQLEPLVKWLRDRIHRWGRAFGCDELLARVTGEGLNADHFVEYLEEKYAAVYRW